MFPRPKKRNRSFHRITIPCHHRPFECQYIFNVFYAKDLVYMAGALADIPPSILKSNHFYADMAYYFINPSTNLFHNHPGIQTNPSCEFQVKPLRKYVLRQSICLHCDDGETSGIQPHAIFTIVGKNKCGGWVPVIDLFLCGNQQGGSSDVIKTIEEETFVIVLFDPSKTIHGMFKELIDVSPNQF